MHALEPNKRRGGLPRTQDGKRRVAFAVRGHCVSAHLHFIADQLLIHQPLCRCLALCGAQIERLRIQERGQPDLQQHLGFRDHLVPHHHRHAVDYTGLRGRGQAERNREKSLSHTQNACPMEKKN